MTDQNLQYASKQAQKALKRPVLYWGSSQRSSRTVVKLWGGLKGPGPPERPDGSCETCFERVQRAQ